MKKFSYFTILLLAGIVFAYSNSCFAQKTESHPAPDVDGKVWMSSTQQVKEAFLFGATSAFVLEYHVRNKHSQEPSKLVRGWVEGLKDMTWRELSHKIDVYYQDNPEKMHRHVFEVIWHEIIMPNWKQ